MRFCDIMSDYLNVSFQEFNEADNYKYSMSHETKQKIRKRKILIDPSYNGGFNFLSP